MPVGLLTTSELFWLEWGEGSTNASIVLVKSVKQTRCQQPATRVVATNISSMSSTLGADTQPPATTMWATLVSPLKIKEARAACSSPPGGAEASDAV